MHSKTVTRAYISGIVWPDRHADLPSSLTVIVETEPCSIDEESAATSQSTATYLRDKFGVDPVSFDVELRDDPRKVDLARGVNRV